jgi:hypothetical protein
MNDESDEHIFNHLCINLHPIFKNLNPIEFGFFIKFKLDSMKFEFITICFESDLKCLSSSDMQCQSTFPFK